MEAQVLKKHNLALKSEIPLVMKITVFLFSNCLFDFGTDAVVEEQDFTVEKFLQLFSDRLQRILFGGFAIRSPEMGHQGDSFSFMVDAVLDGWQCSDDTLIVGDLVRGSPLLWNLFESIDCFDVRYGGMVSTLKSTLRGYQRLGPEAMLYLIRTFLPLIWSAMSVIASLLERDILLERDEPSLRRIVNGCLQRMKRDDCQCCDGACTKFPLGLGPDVIRSPIAAFPLPTCPISPPSKIGLVRTY